MLGSVGLEGISSVSAWCLRHKGKFLRMIRRRTSNSRAKKDTCSVRPELTVSFSAVLYFFTLLGVSLFLIWEPHCVAMNCSVEPTLYNSFEVAIRTSFFDDVAESLGKKRLVVDVVDERCDTR